MLGGFVTISVPFSLFELSSSIQWDVELHIDLTKQPEGFLRNYSFGGPNEIPTNRC